MAGEPIARTFPATGEQVWEALRQTIADLRYKDVNENAAAGTLEFRTGLSLWSWRGQQMTGTVSESGPVLDRVGQQLTAAAPPPPPPAT